MQGIDEDKRARAMQTALAALRGLAAGTCDEAAVFQEAAAVPLQAVNETDEKQVSKKDHHAGCPAVNDTDLDVHADAESNMDESDTEDLDKQPQVLRSSSAGKDECEGISELYTWGRSKNYQLGFGAIAEEQPIPRLVQLQVKTNVKMVSCSRFHTIVVTSCGSVLTWGFGGTTGRLGVTSNDGGEAVGCVMTPTRIPEFGPGRHHAVKTSAGCDHSLTMTAAGKILVWGSNEFGQLGVAGTPTGEKSVLSRPVLLKTGPLKGLRALDIAAGHSHSLCIVEGSGVWAWGSNSFGATGLGAPPTGPTGPVATPQQLPHLKGTAVFGSAASHVSVVIGAHGDAIMFGCAVTKISSNVVASDPKFYSPQRVRRNAVQKRKGSDLEAHEEWQMQKGSTMSPLQNVALGSKTAFGVDGHGSIWMWKTISSRPCVAERLLIDPKFGMRSPGSTLKRGAPPNDAHIRWRSVAIAESLGAIWATDDSPSRCLWHLRRDPDLAADQCEAWSAERSELLSQVSSVCCGHEHQTAIVSYRRPRANQIPTRQASQRPPIHADDNPSWSDAIGGNFVSEIAPGPGSMPHPYVPEYLNPASLASGCIKPVIEAEPQSLRPGPLSLQEICEQKLCTGLNPRNFNVLCDVAWELNRPFLIDRAFDFLYANAALMFSRQYLPILAQLAPEILVALQAGTSDSSCSPSACLEGMASGSPGPWDDILQSAPYVSQSPTLGPNERTGSTDEFFHEASGSTSRRKRRGSGGTSNTGTPQSAPLTKASPHIPAATNSPSPSLQVLQPKSNLARPAQEEAWVIVSARRKMCTGISGSPSKSAGYHLTPAQLPAKLPTPKIGACGSPTLSSAKSPTGPKAANPDAVLTQQLPLSTFVRAGRPSAQVRLGPAHARAEASAGPSAMLAAAMQSAQIQITAKQTTQAKPSPAKPACPKGTGKMDPSPNVLCATDDADVASGSEQIVARASADKACNKTCWSSPKVAPDTPANLREILAVERGSAGIVADGASKKDSRRKVSEDSTKCAWGFEAKPSEQPKGESMYDLQQQEVQERGKQKEEDEIREIEAMFAALEIAELEEEKEFLGIQTDSTATAEAPVNTRKKSRKGAGKGLTRTEAGKSSDGSSGWDKRDGWSTSGWDNWTSFDWSESHSSTGKSQRKVRNQRFGAETHAGGGQRWKPKDTVAAT